MFLFFSILFLFLPFLNVLGGLFYICSLSVTILPHRLRRSATASPDAANAQMTHFNSHDWGIRVVSTEMSRAALLYRDRLAPPGRDRRDLGFGDGHNRCFFPLPPLLYVYVCENARARV